MLSFFFERARNVWYSILGRGRQEPIFRIEGEVVSAFPEEIEVTTTPMRLSSIHTSRLAKTFLVADRNNTAKVFMGDEIKQHWEIVAGQREEILADDLYNILLRAESGTQKVRIRVEREV